MGLLTDNFLKVAVAGAATYMASPGKAVGATSFNLNAAAGFPTDTAFVIALRTVDAQGKEIVGTYTEWLCTLSGTTVSLGTSPSPVVGTDQIYAAGETTQCYVPLSAFRDNRLVSAILGQHNQDGSHAAVTATSLTVSGSTGLAAVSATSAAISGNETVGGKLTVTGQLQVTAGSIASGATITPNAQIYDVTNLATNATIAVPSWTPWNGAPFVIRLVDNGSSQGITLAAGYSNISGLAMPTSTTPGKFLTLAGMYNSAVSSYQIMGIIQSS